jgi:hypothetical protein
MIDLIVPQIDEYFFSQVDVFTADDFYHYFKSRGLKISKSDVTGILHSSDYVFPLINQEYITRAGVFEGRWFSFLPSKEEIDKGQIMLGHRCMPFINPNVSQDAVSVMVNNKLVRSESAVFTMNLALDTFALFGEGYVIPFIINDPANTDVSLSAVQYSMPNEIRLTSWPLEVIAGPEGIKYGDRILCRVIDWANNVVEMSVLREKSDELVISEASVLRENWYTDFENGLLHSFDKNGPGDSIEEQLALLYLENQEQLCIKECGSAEEFLKHTTKIGFSSYGVETRIWRIREEVPYVGEWNQSVPDDLILSDLTMRFTPPVLDAYLEDFIYQNLKSKKKITFDELADTMFPQVLHITSEERKRILLNIEKRHDIIKEKYNSFSDYGVAPIRHRILELFTHINELVCDIASSNVSVSDFPQQELVILSQLFSHVAHLLEDVENLVLRDQFPFDDVSISLDGMEETFEDIVYTLKSSLERNKYKGFGLVE